MNIETAFSLTFKLSCDAAATSSLVADKLEIWSSIEEFESLTSWILLLICPMDVCNSFIAEIISSKLESTSLNIAFCFLIDSVEFSTFVVTSLISLTNSEIISAILFTALFVSSDNCLI